ncbi:MAG: ADP-ribose pyrophosphatase [Verrucomicrobia bacterium]|nr:ADP-ribose pyrophosphatase [Verrucomicrobiota bacterium]
MKEATISRKSAFKGKLLKLDVLEVELENGLRARREIVRHPGAAVILPQLPDGRFVLVRQFRKAVETETLEVVAGTLGKGENPDRCAVRELREETGYGVAKLIKLVVAFPAPGYTDERMHMYFAKLKPAKGTRCPDDDEKLDVVYRTELEIDRLVSRGRIGDAKTLASWALYKSMVKGRRLR